MYMFGASLIASALAFGNLFNKFYIASSFHYTQLFPWGSHPLLDPMLSTETTEILHDGAHLTRTEKIVALSQWPVTYSRLHPCLFDTSFVNGSSRVENCCLCERCVPTMGLLEALGALEKYTVFHKPLTQRNMRNVPFFDIPEKGDRKYLYTREAIDFTGKMGRNDIARNLLYGIIRHKCLMHPEKKARHFIKEMLKAYSMTNSKE